MKLVKMTRDDGHPANVHPEMVDDYVLGGYRVDDDQSDAEEVQELATIDIGQPIPVKAGDTFTLDGVEGIISPVTAADAETLTAAQVLEMAGGNFMAFKSAAAKVLGDKCPSKKAEIIEALKAAA